MAEDTAGLTPEVVATIARGLYWIANVDGIVDSETAVIDEFLRETGSEWDLQRVQESPFDPRELPAVLETSFLRRLFLKAAVALVAADGGLSESEAIVLRRSARLLGLSDRAYGELEGEARTLSIATATKAKGKKDVKDKKAK